MQTDQQDRLRQRLTVMRPVRPVGRVAEIGDGVVRVRGLEETASIGDRLLVKTATGGDLRLEVVHVGDDGLCALPEGPLQGLTRQSAVLPDPGIELAPCDAWLGRVLDASGQPLDERPLPPGPVSRGIQATVPPAALRRDFGARLETGCAALNTYLPLVRGQRIGLFAGSGVGKTSLLGTLARHVACDVIVIALVGERGRELGHFTRSVLGPEGMRKCVVVAATSDRSALERRRCALTAMTIAEHFRDAGKSVLYIADSVTRLAEAHREIASAAGEVPVLRGHPASTARLVAELCERAGPGAGTQGDITAVFSVLVAGSDMEEPVADMLRGVLDGHVVLNRSIAERGRYPAIDLLQSVSRSLPAAASDEENRILSSARAAVSIYQQNETMIRAGLYTEGADAALDQAVRAWPELDSFMGRTGALNIADGFDQLRLILRRSGLSW